MIELTLNGKRVEVDADGSMPLLWAIRDIVGLTGTKYGCGKALCGSCVIHIDGRAVRACVTPLSAAVGKKVTTIEGLSAAGDHPVQRAWIELDVPQCGYCQAGQIMSAAALLAKIPEPTDDQIERSMAGNLCRCGTYPRIRAGIHRAAKLAKGEGSK